MEEAGGGQGNRKAKTTKMQCVHAWVICENVFIMHCKNKRKKNPSTKCDKSDTKAKYYMVPLIGKTKMRKNSKIKIKEMTKIREVDCEEMEKRVGDGRRGRVGQGG